MKLSARNVSPGTVGGIIKVGGHACALFKASSVILGVS